MVIAVMSPRWPLAVARQRGACDELGDRCAGQQHEQPDADQLEPAAQTSCLRQQPQHHETQAEVVRLGECVQSRQRIGETEQPDGAREKEEGARRDGGDRHDVERKAHPPSFGSRLSPRMALPFLTKAMEAKVASSATVSATSTAARHAGHRAEQQQCRDPARSDQLRRHHAVGLSRAAQDADQPQRQHRQDDAEGGGQELSHGRAPAPAPLPPRPVAT